MVANKKLVFLFGSGISIPAKFPKTAELTKKILSGDGVVRASDGIYYLSEDSSGYPLTAEYIPRVKNFLLGVKREIDHYYLNMRKTNYEDLYYLLKQILDSELGDYDNPALNSLIVKISSEIAPLLKPDENGTKKEWTLIELTDEACKYIFDIVWHSLVKPPEQLDHLHSILDACLDEGLSHIDICTLNHDTLLEQCLNLHLANNQIQLNDGFGPLESGSRYWDSSFFEDENIKVRLLKLHGSISWFKIHNPTEGEKVVIPPQGWDIDNVKDNQGQIQRPAGRRPLFLAGTFNKMLDYTQSIFADLYCQFHKSLWKTSSLVVCGYSFHDKGINMQIAEWLFAEKQHKLLVIHSEPETLLRSARGAISNNWERYWLKSHQLYTIPKMIEDVSWTEISSCLESKNSFDTN